MAEKLRLMVRRSVLSDPHLWIAFALAVVYLLLRILREVGWLPWEIPSEGLLFVITICIISIVADRLKLGDEIRDNGEKLGRIADSLFDKKVCLRSRPSTPQEYHYLWGGFKGKYYVYNPAYRVDENTGEDEIVKIFLHRYQDPYFEGARYLFLTKDDAARRTSRPSGD